MDRTPHTTLAARLLLLALGAPAFATSDDAPVEHRIPEMRPKLPMDQVGVLDASLEYIRQSHRIPGLAVGIVDNGVPVYARAFGVRDTATDEPVTVHTLFHVASITKTLTATGVMQLVQNDRLALSDSIGSHLPAFADSPIEISHLLTHSAGLQDVRHESSTVEEYVAMIASRDLAYPPGLGWEYSDTAFNLLGATIEAITGEDYADYMRTHVLAVAGMTESTFDAPAETANFAWPHPGEIFVRRGRRYPWDRVSLPSAGLNASIADMMRWASAFVHRDPALLAQASYDEMLTHQRETAWDGMAMGLGWQLDRRGDRWLPRHAGGEHGFSSLLTLYPEQRRAIIILSNSETTPRGAIRSVVEAALANDTIIYPTPPLLIRRDVQWVLGVVVLAVLASVVALLVRRRKA